MASTDIFFKYRIFLREKVQKEYLSQFERYKVLGENIINGYYIVLFEATIEEKRNWFIIVENIDKPVFSEMKPVANNYGYITMNKGHLHHLLPEKCLKEIAKRGYASNFKIGLKRGRFCFHRLVACLYYNCIGLEVHHIDKNIKNNCITNLIPLDKEHHGYIDNDGLNGEHNSKDIQKHLKNNYFKTRKTLATRDITVLKILLLKVFGTKTTKIIKLMKKQIKKSKVYETLNYFYYADDFLKWLQTFNPQSIGELYGNLDFGWFFSNGFEYDHIYNSLILKTI